MLKPLSKKSLEKKYAELSLSEEKLEALHCYFRSFSNLYGLISVQEAWEIFREYEGTSFVHKRGFVAFAEVVQREEGLPYYIIDVDEIYSEEKPSAEWRMIVNKDLVLKGYNRFIRLYCLDEKRMQYPAFIPEKDVFLSFSEDKFYKTNAGKDFVDFICSLKSSGTGMDYNGKEYTIMDVDGRSIKGRRLDDISVVTREEQFDIEYTKNESLKKELTQKCTRKASAKVLEKVKNGILEGSFFEDDSLLDQMVKMISEDYGVIFTNSQLEKYARLYTEINNTAHMWCMFGWSPNELAKRNKVEKPSFVSIGPNMKKMIENGELDVEEIKKEFDKLGIKMML